MLPGHGRSCHLALCSVPDEMVSVSAMIAAQKVAEILGDEAVLQRRVRDPEALEAVVRDRLPFASLQSLVAAGRLTLAEVKDLVLPSSTYARRAKEDALSVTESERVERLARVIATAEEVFLDTGRAHRWLRAAHPELGGRTPLAVAASELGARRIETLLWQIAHGIPA
jgi:putative toxin-antitoxin system antitoxin component (TIGR02293 family)